MAELVVIFTFVLVATVVSFAFASSIHKRHIAYKERKEALEREQRGGHSAQQFEKLEERVRVLERITTDSNHALASEIETLRIEEIDREVN